jgi:CubicO group peptidase (beta-lactamase class C family)
MNPLRLKLSVCTVAALLVCSSNHAQVVSAPELFDPDQLDAYLAAQVRVKGRVGLSVAIVKNGQVVLAKAYGSRSLEEQLPVESDTQFAIGSVTKQFTCACLLLLAQDGKLSVHDKVSGYFPKLTRAADVRLLDLMNHASGYPDYYPLDFVDSRMQKTISADGLIQRYAGGRLDFEPGTDWSYSNTGFIILGRIVEKVSGRSFAQFLESRILQPLGMKHTTLAPDPKGKSVATGYTTFALSDAEPATPEATGWAGAAGALYSTPGDLVKWDMALIGGKILKPKYYQLMTASRELSNGIVTGYGCGLAVGVQERRTVLRHSGAVSGFNAFNAIIPSTQSAVVLLCNKDGGLGSLPDVLTTLLLRAESNVPKVSGIPAVDVVKRVFSQFQSGVVDRDQLGEEFGRFLSEAKLAAAAKRLKALGAPQHAEVIRTRERGGMEVTTTSLSFENKNLEVLMYRTPKGRIEQFFIDEK